MPKLKGGKEKYVNGNVSVDKENADVIYSDKDHIYLGKKQGFDISYLIELRQQRYLKSWDLYL